MALGLVVVLHSETGVHDEHPLVPLVDLHGSVKGVQNKNRCVSFAVLTLFQVKIYWLETIYKETQNTIR